MNTNNLYQFNEDEIDIQQIKSRLLRRKNLIACATGISILISGVYSFIKKPVWEGEVQIVLSTKESSANNARSALLQANPLVAGLLGSGSNQNDLDTEVEILKSPSILMPVFNFVKENKKTKNKNLDQWRFHQWMDDHLDIELQKGTSVLNLTYRDTQKDLIIPVLNNISSKYQIYSGRERIRGIKKGIAFLNKKIEEYKNKVIKSRREALQFSIKNDLPLLEIDNLKNDLPNENIDAIRIKASNQIRKIEKQLKQIQSIYNDDAILQYSKIIYKSEENPLIDQIDKLDSDLSIALTKFRDNDKNIISLREQRSALINLLKNKTINFLIASRSQSSAIQESAFRPKEILIKSREILRELAREEETLSNLEAEQRILSLEQARNTEPWELITEPTLFDRRVSPRRKRIIALGMIFGFIGSSIAALYFERNRNLIFKKEEIERLIKIPLLETFSTKEFENWNQSLNLLVEGALFNKNKNEDFALIPFGELDKELVKKFALALKEALNKDVTITRDLLVAKNYSSQLLITGLGVADKEEVIQLEKRLSLQGNSPKGWILILS